MIKKYFEFISYNGFNSLGEWVESLIKDEYIRNIVARYTKESDPSVELSNSINILDDKTKQEIKAQIDHYLENGIEEKEPQILVSTDVESLTEALSEEVTVAGKGIFTSFLKVLTGLGKKETEPNWEKCPEDFILFYYYPNLDSQVVKQLFSRFKSLVRYVDLVDYQQNEVNLYFGVKCDGEFEYGLHYENNQPLGRFKLSQSTIKWICQLESKSAHSLKKELVNLTYADILLFGKIKSDMKLFQPGYHEKRLSPMIKDRVISFGYYGVGKWDNGKLDEGEFQNIKNNFTTWLLSKRWGNKVLISVKPMSFWLYLHIKLK
jgi:hypothetical protein